MRSVFFGPSVISGIGQVTRKYADIVQGDFIEFGEAISGDWDIGFAFIIPIDSILEIIKRYAKHCKKMIYYTICETRPVHKDYGKLLELSDTIWTSSEFCSGVLKEQFPSAHFPVLYLYAPIPKYIVSNDLVIPKADYIFYHIGNILDNRKNIKRLIEAFYRSQVPNSLLVLKATCRAAVSHTFPNVYIINDFLSAQQMEQLHRKCHCYVSFSHSEGAGMGAVEAALRDKPVIIQEYGATKEYIPDTPFIVRCTETPVGVDDFLFCKEHMWGEPSMDDMIRHMKKVSGEKITHWDHSGTRSLMSNVKNKMLEMFLHA